MKDCATYRDVERELRALGNSTQAASSMRFFKTKKGEYAAGDIFLGLTVPQTRAVVKKYQEALTLPDIEKLLQSKFHEFRLAALFLLVVQYERAKDGRTRKAIFICYTKNTKYINNWDLVDTSARQIVGAYISEEMEHAERLAFINGYCRSRDLWKNRIIVLATLYQIQKGNEKMLFYVARELLHHSHDLIHKAIGWMLREVGKRDRKVLSGFLREYAGTMPRTMLRYALEHYPPKDREYFMKMKVASM